MVDLEAAVLADQAVSVLLHRQAMALHPVLTELHLSLPVAMAPQVEVDSEEAVLVDPVVSVVVYPIHMVPQASHPHLMELQVDLVDSEAAQEDSVADPVVLEVDQVDLEADHRLPAMESHQANHLHLMVHLPLAAQVSVATLVSEAAHLAHMVHHPNHHLLTEHHLPVLSGHQSPLHPTEHLPSHHLAMEPRLAVDSAVDSVVDKVVDQAADLVENHLHLTVHPLSHRQATEPQASNHLPHTEHHLTDSEAVENQAHLMEHLPSHQAHMEPHRLDSVILVSEDLVAEVSEVAHPVPMAPHLSHLPHMELQVDLEDSEEDLEDLEVDLEDSVVVLEANPHPATELHLNHPVHTALLLLRLAHLPVDLLPVGLLSAVLLAHMVLLLSHLPRTEPHRPLEVAPAEDNSTLATADTHTKSIVIHKLNKCKCIVLDSISRYGSVLKFLPSNTEMTVILLTL